MNAVELFAGAGGLALGVARAGFKHLALVEIEKNACATIRENIARGVEHVADWPLVEADVRTFDFSSIQCPVDLLAAGVPCQPFSIGGRGLAQYDERNMFPDAIHAISALRPRAVVIENVKGLLRPGLARYLDYVRLRIEFPECERESREPWTHHRARIRRLKERGGNGGLEYDVDCRMLNAADFGVPQWRERVFFVAFRRDLGVQWTWPTPAHSLDALLWSQWITGDYWAEHGLPRRKRATGMAFRYARRLERLKELGEHDATKARWLTIRDALVGLTGLRQGQTAKDDPNHFLNPGARSYTKHVGASWDEPAKTLKAGSHGVPGGENILALGRGRVRYFSVRECARLQTFPDEFRFAGPWCRAMRQVGNAVPVVLAEKVVAAVASHLQSKAAAVRGSRVKRPAAQVAVG